MEHHVCILRSQADKEKIYTRYTNNLKNRLKKHLEPNLNAYKKRHAPWELETYLIFKDKDIAQKFEVYLKS